MPLTNHTMDALKVTCWWKKHVGDRLMAAPMPEPAYVRAAELVI